MFLLSGVKYKEILYIDHLEIPDGQVTCIVGESGSGKTTLLRLLNHLISYDEGDIFFCGQNVKDIDPVQLRRRVVMLPQTPVIFPGNIKENLLAGLRFAEKLPASGNRLLEVMNLVHLGKEIGEDASRLSGGEKQRLALARVLLLEPEVLLLDEPSSALDEETEKLVIENVYQYVKSGKKTLVMVTHAREIARAYGENIIEIAGGRVKGSGGRAL